MAVLILKFIAVQAVGFSGFSFCTTHGSITISYQLFPRFSMVGIECDTDTERNMDFLSLQFEREDCFIADLLGNGNGIIRGV